MWKFLAILLIVAAIIAGGGYYYTVIRPEEYFVNAPVLFTAYGHSIDDLSVIPGYQDPKYEIEKSHTGRKIPDKLFQESISTVSSVEVLEIVSVAATPSDFLKFYLVKTSEGKFTHVAGYRLAERSGTPLQEKPRKGHLY